MPHFHNSNPWAGTLVYLPDLEEFLDAISSKEPKKQLYRARIEALEKYDLYVLKGGELGVRFGTVNHQYITPLSDEEKGKALFAKYSGPTFPLSIETALREAAAAGIGISIIYWPESYWSNDERWQCRLEYKIKVEETGAGPEVVQKAWLAMKTRIGNLGEAQLSESALSD